MRTFTGLDTGRKMEKEKLTQRPNESENGANSGEAGLEAEQESAAAMDADVPRPPDETKTTEGQPSK
jgi:hypothetical protein